MCCKEHHEYSVRLQRKPSNFSGENNGVNSAWYLILEAIDEASGGNGLRALEDSTSEEKK
ncbi:hypothetical protein CCACVL1_16180 [Corchorus capsularis]|uniref:Uncharacterized protein n=1 Tax=Corchorus capsularis TaxID=210143 RepID=A0A1R3HYI5_COCAP|nr:hypothetical protein CCACVL1_16180 [Corchorus capsularis]